jgi:hypothetical protein
MGETRGQISPTYYVDNFATLLGTVATRYQHLLAAEEARLLVDFPALPRGARCLWVRLLSRKGPLFRSDRLSYPEIESVNSAIEHGEQAAFFDSAPDAGLEQILPLFTVPELREAARDLGCRLPAAVPRAEIVAALLGEVPPGAAADHLRQGHRLVRPLRIAEVRALRLLFFGNLRQDWSEMVLAQLDVRRYEPYELGEERAFPDRRSVDDTLYAAARRRELRRLISAGDLAGATTIAEALVGRECDWSPTALPLVDRTLIELAQALERAGEVEPALELYRNATLPPARERAARLLDRIDRDFEAIALCREIEASPRDESERLFAPRFVHRLQRRRGQVPALHRRRRRTKTLRIPRDPAVPIEQQAVAAFRARQQIAFHSENWLWRSLFGLTFWDILFQSVPGAFHHPYQPGPSDLFEAGFRARREGAIAGRLDEIRAGEWSGERIFHLWQSKRHISNALVSWSAEAGRNIEIAADTVGGPHLAAICDRLSRDLRRYRNGLPDLFVLNHSDLGFELLEVKGPGDQLRPEQRSWLDFLDDAGIPAMILAVRWA